MWRLKITRDEGHYYWEITRNGEVICAGLSGFASEAEADARAKWAEYTGVHA